MAESLARFARFLLGLAADMSPEEEPELVIRVARAILEICAPDELGPESVSNGGEIHNE